MAVGVICDGLHGQSALFVGLAVVLKGGKPRVGCPGLVAAIGGKAALLPNDSFPLSRLTSQPFKGQSGGERLRGLSGCSDPFTWTPTPAPPVLSGRPTRLGLLTRFRMRRVLGLLLEGLQALTPDRH